MALLRTGLATIGLMALGACSLVVDAESLKAQRAGDAPTEDLVDPADTADTTPPADADATEPDITIVKDVDEDISIGDVSDVADTEEVIDDVVVVEVTDVSGDVAEVADLDDVADDIIEPDDVLDVIDPPEDIGPTEALIFTHTGQQGCTLDYYLQSVTFCPKLCDWSFSFDATDSIGVTSFSWRFAVTNGYGLNPVTGTGPTPTTTISTPACLVFGAGSMVPGQLLVEAAINGGDLEVVKTIDFGVRQVSTCPTQPKPACVTP